jgi:hypothetical protein
MSDKLSKEAREYINTPIQVGDYVKLPLILVQSFSDKNTLTSAYVNEILPDGKCIIKIEDASRACNGKTFELNISDLEKDPLFVGYNPF